MIRLGLLGALVLLLLPSSLMGQDLERHGEVVGVRSETIEVLLDQPHRVEETATGTVFAQDTIGGEVQTVPVASMVVEAVNDRVITGRVTEQAGLTDPAVGFEVSFDSVQRADLGKEADPAVLRLSSSPPGAEVEAQPLRATATGRTVNREPLSLGTTPLVDSLMPGRYRVVVEQDGYRIARRTFLLESGSTTTDSLHLEMNRREGR